MIAPTLAQSPALRAAIMSRSAWGYAKGTLQTPLGRKALTGDPTQFIPGSRSYAATPIPKPLEAAPHEAQGD